MARGLLPKAHLAGPLLTWALLAWLLPAPASAQPCDDVNRWAETCGEGGGPAVRVLHCLPGGVVLEARARGGEPLRVEVARNRPEAFRHVGGLGVSPVGEFADWDEAPEDLRAAFEGVLTCVRERPSLAVPEGRLEPSGETPPSPPTPALPWLLFGGLLLAAFALALGLRRTRPSRARVIRVGLSLSTLSVATFFVRGLLSEPAFLHQNGQGPLWVSHALCVSSAYGPGYQEVFGWAAALGGEPSATLFTAQALLAALGPAFLWIASRAAGARASVAWAAAAVLTMEPTLARLAQSESYFGISATLLLLSAAILSAGAFRRRALDPHFLLAVAAAGMLVAQTARIHPTSWAPAAILPLVVLVGRGRLRSRLAKTGVATAGVGLIAALGALGVVLGVTSGDLGAQWLPSYFERLPGSRLEAGFQVAALGTVLLVALARDRKRVAVRAAAFFVAVGTAVGTHVIGGVGPTIVWAYLVLFAGPVLITLAASLRDVERRRWHGHAAALGLAAVGLLLAWGRAAPLLEIPTDALEQRWVLAHRERLPPGAAVAFLGVAGRRRLHLPLYGSCAPGRARAIQLESEVPRDLAALPEPIFWYRSSLCSSGEGRSLCERIEATYSLHPVDTTDLPARPSMEGLDYDRRTIHVGLYQVAGRR